MFYALDGIKCLDYDEIAKRFNITVGEVDEILDKSISKITKSLKYNSFTKKEKSESYNKTNKYLLLISIYGEKRVIKARNFISDIKQKMIKKNCSNEDRKTLNELSK